MESLGKMFTHKNLMTVCCAAVLAFGLAACGSSSDDDSTLAGNGGPMPGNGGPMPVVVDLTTVTDGTTAEAGTLEIEAGMSEDSGNTAFACAADGDDCTVTVTVGDDGTVTAESTGGDVIAGNSAAHQITLNGPAGPTATPEQITAAAATKATAIAEEAKEAGTDDAGIGGSVASGEDTTYDMTISRDRDGTTVEITDTENDGADDPKFVQAMDFGDGRTMHLRDNGMGEEEVVIVSTDIDEPTATPFAEVEGQTLNTSTDDVADTNEALAVNENAEAVRALIRSAAFTSNTVATLTFDNNDPDTADRDEAFETEGTYNGAMGTYRCDGTGACTVTLNAEGAITAMSDGWIFTPDTGATSDVADADYLNYGFWLMRTTKDGATTYDEVETFAEATGFAETVDTTLDAVTGTAMYEGGSVGVYVKNVLDNQGGIVSATSGHFSADVALTATFGGGNLPVNNQFTIGGKITGFVLQHGEANDWAVGLGLADFGNREGVDPGESAPGSGRTTTFTGVAIGDSTALPGTWNGAFHGAAGQVDHDGDPDTPGINTPPAAVVGEFNANFTDGTAAGGFGVNKK